MTTLLEYAQQHFPEHEVECPDGAVPLNDITVVAHVVGRTRAASLVEGLRKALHAGIAREEPRIKTVIVEPTSPTMVNSGGEDPEGVVDLPVRRLAVGALIGGVILGSIVGVVRPRGRCPGGGRGDGHLRPERGEDRRRGRGLAEPQHLSVPNI